MFTKPQLKAFANLRAEAIHLVVIPGDAHEARAKYLRAENLGGLEIGGDKDPGVEALPGRLGRDGIGEIARGGATDGLEAEGPGLRQGDGDDAILEGERGEIHGVIFQVEAARAKLRAQPGGGDERRHAHGDFGLVSLGNGQQLRIPPQIGGTPGDVIGGEGFPRDVEVVFNFERSQAVFADGTGAITPFAITFATTQRVVLAHADLPGVRRAQCAPKKNAPFRV